LADVHTAASTARASHGFAAPTPAAVAAAAAAAATLVKVFKFYLLRTNAYDCVRLSAWMLTAGCVQRVLATM